jgi:hypothetical protein
MGRVAYTLYGGAEFIKKYPVGATFANPGVIAVGTGAGSFGVIPCTATGALLGLGLSLDTATYSATPAKGATGILTVSMRPDNVIAMRASGGATEGTSLGIVTATADDASTPDTVTGTLPTANSMVGGTLWRYKGEGQICPLRESHVISVHTSTTSVAVGVDFEYPILIGDQFLMVPWTIMPGDGTDTNDGGCDVNMTTNLYEANGAVASGDTGIGAWVVDLLLKGATDSEVLFTNPYHAAIVGKV